MTAASASEIVAILGLQPHPEGRFFRETFRDGRLVDGNRAASTAIYYLLARDDISARHRVDAVEVWHWYAGAALALTLSESGKEAVVHHLGPHLTAGQRPQIIVPVGTWQSAVSLGAWTLAGCTVAPGFLFEGFELWTERACLD